MPSGAPTVSFSDREQTRTRTVLRGLLELSPFALWAALLLYHHYVFGPTTYVYGTWEVSRMDWLFAFALICVAVFVVAPMIRNPRLTRRRLAKFTRNRVAAVCLAWVVLFVVVGLVGPVIWKTPRFHIHAILQPPVGFTVPRSFIANCVGPVSDGLCHGTWQYPFGTQQGGMSMASYIAYGARRSLEVGLTTATLVVLIGTTVGVTAAYAGGWTDELLMRYVDVQQSIPSLFVYLAVLALYTLDPFFLVAVFGLTSWGGIARIVRSEALKVREEEYVQAAKGHGAGTLYAIRKHVLPNVSSTVVTTASLQLPTFIVVEATIGFLNIGDTDIYSWGVLINRGLEAGVASAMWWVALEPVVVLALTVVAFNVVGDRLRDTLDPRDA